MSGTWWPVSACCDLTILGKQAKNFSTLMQDFEDDIFQYNYEQKAKAIGSLTSPNLDIIRRNWSVFLKRQLHCYSQGGGFAQKLVM